MVTMRRHIQEKHDSTVRIYPPATCDVQTIFESNATRYPVIVPLCAPAPATQPSALTYAAATYRAIYDVRPELEDRAQLNPFLAKYNWMTIISPLHPRQIQDWVSLPGDTESVFSGLEDAIKAYYNIIVHEMGDSGQYITTLRWLKSSKK
jgi:hypothetical protein